MIKATMEQLGQTKNEQEQPKLASQLQSILTKYERLRTRLNAELHIQAAVREMLDESLTEIAKELGLTEEQVAGSAAVIAYALDWTILPEDMPSLEALKTRTITLQEGGLGGAKSIKFSNMNLVAHSLNG